MKKILFIVCCLAILFAFTVTSFAQSISYPATNEKQYSYNKYTSVITGYNNFFDVEISTNYFEYTARNNISNDSRTPNSVFSDSGKMLCWDIYNESLGNGDYYNIGSFVYDYIDYFSINFANYINLYNSYDIRASSFSLFPFSFFSDGSIEVILQGYLYLYYSDNAQVGGYDEYYVYKLPLSSLVNLYESAVSVTTYDWVKSCNSTILQRYGDLTRYCLKLPHIVAIDYLSTISTELVPIGYQYVDANITFGASTRMGVVQNNLYSTNQTDTNGDNFLTVELLGGYINEEGYPYDNDFGIKDSVELILDSPFILNISYINWLYILCGIVLLSYLFKLFLGG